jgi:uncharacterized protein (TIGR02145 family)
MKKVITLLLLIHVAVFAQQKGIFTDSRDGKKYKTVKIGTQTWMAENLNYSSSFDCYYISTKYGYNEAKKICPSGWHLPNNEEWDILINFAGGKENAGKKLKAKTGWNSNVSRRGEFISSGNGTDDYGFAALPGGVCNKCWYEGYLAGESGFWWSATKGKNAGECVYSINSTRNNVSENAGLIIGGDNTNECFGYSVRCVKDEAGAIVAIQDFDEAEWIVEEQSRVADSIATAEAEAKEAKRVQDSIEDYVTKKPAAKKAAPAPTKEEYKAAIKGEDKASAKEAAKAAAKARRESNTRKPAP